MLGLYIVIGVIVLITTFNKIRSILCGSWEDDISAYIGTFLWGLSIIGLWPLVLLYLFARTDD